MRKKGFVLALAVALSATAAMAAEGPGIENGFLHTHGAQLSMEAGTLGGVPGGAAFSLDGIGGKISYGGRHNGSDVGVVVETRIIPDPICRLAGMSLLPGVVEPFLDFGTGFTHGKAILSIGGGLSLTPGVKIRGYGVVVNVGYSKLQGAFGGVGLKF